MTNLPTPSGNMMKVMLLLRDEDVEVKDLVAAIEKDQSMVAQILKLVNSGFYGLRKTVETVEHAIALLGIINIKQVVYSASIMEFFTDDEQLEWNHSYSSSILMSNLIHENELPGINILPLAMLMHDLGKVVLRRFSPKKYQVVHQRAAADRLPVFRVEESMLLINHAEVGGLLLEKWDSAPEIVKPVLQHHMDTVPEEFVFETALVQFVNWADCTARGIPCYEPSREIMNAAGIEEIDKNYWVDAQRRVIESLENPNKGKPVSTSGTINRKAPAAQEPVESPDVQQASAAAAPSQGNLQQPVVASYVSASQGAVAPGGDAPVGAAEIETAPHVELPGEPGLVQGGQDSISTSVLSPTPSPAAIPEPPPIVLPAQAPENDTAELVTLPANDLPADTAVVNLNGPQVSVSARPSASNVLSEREQAMLRVAYNEPVHQQPLQTTASTQQDVTPAFSDRPTQVLSRKGPNINIKQLPPEPKIELPPQPTPSDMVEGKTVPPPGMRHQTQVISRRTGQPLPIVPPPVKPVPHQLPPDEEPQPVKIPRKEDTDLVITTNPSIAPPTEFADFKRPKKKFFARLLDWLKQQL